MTSDRLDGETSYDLVPYESRPYPQTHPDRLATVATLFGGQPASPAGCRVLELGCASGGNILPMAVALPGATFLGIDASARQIEEGRRTIDALGLDNVELRQEDILAATDLGSFDYIVCHGVFSWVPHAVRARILAICEQSLDETGVAFVSYNTYPGWHFRGLVRDMMRYHAARFDDPETRVRQAGALLDFLASSVPAKDSPYGQLLRQELELLRRVSGSYVFHEHLEDVNEPLYFHRFVELAGEHGLQYLGEADVSAMAAYRFPEDVRATLGRISTDMIQAEQYLDFLRNRMFRQTLLCRRGAPLDHSITAERLSELHVAAGVVLQVEEDGKDRAVIVRGRRGEQITTRDSLLIAALRILSEAWPASLPFTRLADRAGEAAGAPPEPRELAARLLRLYLSAGPIELHSIEPAFVKEISERPRASELARHQSGRGTVVTNLRHESLRLADGERFVIGLLDGSRDHAAIVDSFADAVRRRALVPNDEQIQIETHAEAAAVAEGAVGPTLRKFAASALLAA